MSIICTATVEVLRALADGAGFPGDPESAAFDGLNRGRKLGSRSSGPAVALGGSGFSAASCLFSSKPLPVDTGTGTARIPP